MSEQIHYIVTLPDGTVPPTSPSSTEPYTSVYLTQHLGQVIDHPTPGRPWYDETPFSYFRTYTHRGVAETLERTQWPARLWLVEPLGETGNWDPRHSPYWVLCHQLRVIEETDAWRAFGPRGQHVLDLLEQQLPGQAREWAQQWTTDGSGTRERYAHWKGRMAQNHAAAWAQRKARSCRREAATRWAQHLARVAAEKAALTVTDDQVALAAVCHRAACLITGVLLHDRLGSDDAELAARDTLHGAGLNLEHSHAS